MIYELRIYEAARGRMPDLNARFRDHTLGLFERHGIESVFYGTQVIGGASNELVYVLRFDDLAHRERAWAAFEADPEWQEAKAASEAEAGPLVERVRSQILKPTDYSPSP